MSLMLVTILILTAALLALGFSTLHYALREYSRAKLADALKRVGREDRYQSTVDHADDLIFVTAIIRRVGNLVVLLGVLHILRRAPIGELGQFALAALIAGTIGLFLTVILPHAMARHDGERMIAGTVRLLNALRICLLPLTAVMHGTERFISRVTPPADEHDEANEQIAQEIMSVVEEGAKEGIVGPQERQMIESVMTFPDKTVAAAMTARTQIVAIARTATLDQVRAALQSSNHSRLPVHDGSLSAIVGMLYSRDLVELLGKTPEKFELTSVMRPVYFVPETKPLRDMLKDFFNQKVQIAIVLDEYGTTAGLVTIKDVLEQVVGEIRDEHESPGPQMMRRLDAQSFEADGRVRLDDFNREMGTSIPEDGGYETLAGFVTSVLGRIPSAGTTFVSNGVRFTVLDAEPQRVKRVGAKLINRGTAANAGAAKASATR